MRFQPKPVRGLRTLRAAALYIALVSGATYALPIQELIVDVHNIKRSWPLENVDSKSSNKLGDEKEKEGTGKTKRGKDVCDEKTLSPDTKFFAPAGSKFTILEQKTENNKKALYTRFKRIPTEFKDLPTEVRDRRRNNNCLVETEYAQYEMDLKDIHYKFSHGLTHGPLTIPFKVQFSDGTLLAGANIGYFMGYRWNHFTLIVPAIGVEFINSSSGSSGNQKTPASLTIAAGVTYDLSQSMHSIGQGLQCGLFLGIDHRTGYEYNDRLWISVGLGYNFNVGGE